MEGTPSPRPSSPADASRLPSKLILTAFGAWLSRDEQDPGWITRGLPPFIAYKGRLRIDFVPFVLHGGVSFDGEVFDQIMHRRHDELAVIRKEMLLLRDAGFLKLENIGAVIKNGESQLERMIERDRKTDMSVWAPGVQDAIRGWLTVAEGLEESLGKYFTPHHRLPYGIQVALQRKRKAATVENGQEMALRLLKPFEQWSNADIADARVASEVYLSLVNQTLFISSHYASTWSDWDNVGKLYQAKLEGVGHDVQLDDTPASKLKEFANFAFPEVKPSTPEELISLITSKEIDTLRQKIKDAADQKIELNDEWARAELLAERQALREAATIRRVTGWLTLPLALFHLPGHLAGKVAEEVVDHVVDHKTVRRFDYLYFLSNRFRSRS